MTGRLVVMRVACLVGLCLMVAGCTPNNDAPPSGEASRSSALTPAGQPASAHQKVVIDFRSDPEPPKAGDNTFEVTVMQPGGAPVTDATVEVVFSMPAIAVDEHARHAQHGDSPAPGLRALPRQRSALDERDVECHGDGDAGRPGGRRQAVQHRGEMTAQ